MKKILTVIFSFLSVALVYAQSYDEAAFQQRKNILINQIADNYGNANSQHAGWAGCTGTGSVLSDFGKYAYPKMIAVFEKYGATTVGNFRVDSMNARLIRYRNCPTFHFNLVGLPRLLYNYSTAPAFTESVRKSYIQRVFNRTDSYNAWTAEGTENHLSMSRVSAYLYAQYAKDNFLSDFPDAPAKLDSMKRWIEWYGKTIYSKGTAEWNSSTYGVYNIISWISLYDFAQDTAIKNVAKAVSDYYATELAIHHSQSMTGGAEMRGGNAFNSLNTGTDWLAWLWYGDSPKTIAICTGSGCIFSGNDYIQSVHAAVSGYRPPAYAVHLAQKTKYTKNLMFYGAKPAYMYEKEGAVKHSFYATKSYSLGAAYTEFGGWSGSDWQIISWKLVGFTDSAAGKNAQFMSGGGMYYQERGLHRKPFDQLVHHKNVLIHLSKVPTNANDIRTTIQNMFTTWRNQWLVDFDQRFPTDTDKDNPVNFQTQDVSGNSSFITIRNTGTQNWVIADNILFIELDKIYVAVRSISSTVPTNPIEAVSNYFRIEDIGTLGNLSGFVIEVDEKSKFASFADFQTAITNNSVFDKSQAAQGKISYTSSKGDVIVAQYNESGTFSEPLYDWGYGATQLNGYVIQTSPPFIQPTWPSGQGHGKMATWTVNGDTVHLNKHWAIYDNPYVKVDNSVLRLINKDSTMFYEVDYSSNQPIFTAGPIVLTSLSKHYETQTSNLFEVYPNPATNEINIKYELDSQHDISLQLFNSTGKLVKNLGQKQQQKGSYTERYDLQNLPKGVYLLRFSNGYTHQTSKLVVQ
jgi:hypothetical protein